MSALEMWLTGGTIRERGDGKPATVVTHTFLENIFPRFLKV